MNNEFSRVKYACYMANVTMSAIANLTPVLLLTFHNIYNLSFSLLAVLVVVNFCTQLGIDLIFSFYSHKFNIEKTVKLIPLISAFGLMVYAVLPVISPKFAYLGLLIGTFIFAFSGGLGEVLISPVIAGIPAKNPEREMSKLHSIYAWDVVFVVIISSVLLLVLGSENWYIIPLFFAVVPIISALLFCKAKMPKIVTPERTSNVVTLIKQKGFILCFLGIFFGGAAECTMAQWSSGYLEYSFSIPKITGDILGVALFSVMLGLGRTLYSKYGKNITKTLRFCAFLAVCCYVTAAVSNVAIVGLISCAMTGLFVSMLWPGSLIAATEKLGTESVALFALMAAGGDLGASIGTQLIGTVTDTVSKNPYIVSLANELAMSPQKIGMKIGFLIAAIFPLIAFIIFTKLHKLKR